MYENDYVYHEVENLGDNEDQNKAPEIVETSTPVSAILDEDKYEEMVHTDLEKTKLGKLRPSYDFKTSNMSFLEVYRDLVNLGIKNNKFFLVIYDRSLVGIDPYNKALPLSVKLRIIAECRRNPWYFLREVCRIPADGLPVEEGGGVSFQLDRSSVAMWYLFLHHIDQYVCKPRQTGKTQGALSIITYAFTLGARSGTILFSNKDAENNKMNLYRMKCQRDMLPSYMQMKLAVGADGSMMKEKNSVTTFQNPVNNNSIKLLPRANSRDSAMSCGRGATAPIFYGDEVDFSPYFNTILESAAYAYSTASQNAIKYKSMAGRIFTSTPGDLDSRDGENIMMWISHMFKWDDKMLDWPIEKLKQESTRIIGESRRNGIIYVEHSWKQLKKTERWYEEQCRLVEYKPEVVQREIDLKRMHGSSMSPFSRQDILYIQKHMKTAPIRELDLSKSLNPFKFYKKMKKSVPYFICVDPSEGLALDNNAVEIEHPGTMEVVAEMQNPYITQTDLGRMLIQFMDLLCPNALIIVENNKGRELINFLLRSKYADRVWYDSQKMLEVTESVRIAGHEQRQALERRAYGVSTNGTSRPVMMGILERLMREEKYKIYTPYVVNDICALIRKPGSGKVEASAGMHDDNVMAFLLGHYVRYNAKNLEEFGVYEGMYGDDMEEMEGFRTKPQKLTPKQQEEADFMQLRQMFPSLPPDLQEMIQDRLFGPEAKKTMQFKKAREEARTNQQISAQVSDLLEDESPDYLARATALASRRIAPSVPVGYGDPGLSDEVSSYEGGGDYNPGYDYTQGLLQPSDDEEDMSGSFNVDDYI